MNKITHELNISSNKLISRVMIIPEETRCSKCDGWGTLIRPKKTYKNWQEWFTFRTISCDRCSRTGFMPIPLSEIL